MKKIIIVITTLAGCSMPSAFENGQQHSVLTGIEIIPKQTYCTEGDIIPLSIVSLLSDGTREKADVSQIQFRTGDRISVDPEGNSFTCIREGTDTLEAFNDSFYSTSSVTVKKKPDYSQIKITEVMYNPVDEDTGKEYIEIMNTGSFQVDIDGCMVIDGSRLSESFVFHRTKPLEPEKRLIAAQSDQLFTSTYGASPDCIPFTFALNNSGETVLLYSPKGELIDAVYICGGSADLPAPSSWGAKNAKTAEGSSIVRQYPSLDTDSASDWIEAAPSPGL
jgi:hypothetical protein